MKVECRHVTKLFRKGSCGIKNVDLTVNTGVLGLLGRNGSGKTTLLKLLATVFLPTKGQILFDGLSPLQYGNELRANMGFLPQNSRLQPSLNVYEFLDYICLLKNIRDKRSRTSEVERCLELVHLQDEKKKKLGEYSGGMLRRAGIAQAMIGNPEIIILDEPMASLDAEEKQQFKNYISEAAKESTVILSTNVISDIENLCHNIAVLDRGSLIFSGSTEELAERAQGKVWECTVADSEAEHIENFGQVIYTGYSKGCSKVRYISDESVYPGSVQSTASLEDAFYFLLPGKE